MRLSGDNSCLRIATNCSGSKVCHFRYKPDCNNCLHYPVICSALTSVTAHWEEYVVLLRWEFLQIEEQRCQESIREEVALYHLSKSVKGARNLAVALFAYLEI